ncbi:unnamed protein product [Microthlaspi erraticum]|uniref:Uncharacterized protein n=1 Tax=Microthlaspi erraticum TaxID=1685480 RepID=A0A6D2JBQ2_9BRAS|nr:unnamed protein product [Microthlaspi erraticum]
MKIEITSMDSKNTKDDATKNAGTSIGNGGSSGVCDVAKTMVAPGSGGDVSMSRDAFESNPKKFFDDLHAKEKK